MEKWLATYDTPDDRRRRQVARILEGYGDRVQFSVFEIVVEAGALTGLLERLQRILDPEEDSLRLYPACARCAQKVICVAGSSVPPWWEPEVYVV